MDELEEIKRRKLEQMQQSYGEQADQQTQDQMRMQQLESVIKQRMTKEAVQRYSNIKFADGDRAAQLLFVLAQVLQTGRLQMIDDEQLKSILSGMTPKRNMTIKRK